MADATSKALLERLEQDLATVENLLQESLDTLESPLGQKAPERLKAAMAHSLLAGGKRLRPLLVVASARATAGVALNDDAVIAAARPGLLAVEYVHTYSLIHDDLPALDDDKLRRGKPTSHIAFDEATAILAGDSLLTDAFAILSTADTQAAKQVRALATACGSAGMVGGQLDDMLSEGKARTQEELASIHVRKTGHLFGACCAIGALSVGADEDTAAKLRAFGDALGLAFQIADDVLDITGDVDKRGKRQGGDVERDKATYVALLGLEGAQKLADETARAAAEAVAFLGERGATLADIARYAAQRTH